MSNRPESGQMPIILLHGWGMNKQIWQGIRESLPTELQQRVTALDLPGFGDNSQILEPYDLTNLSNWLNEQVHSPSIVIGWSLGGLVAQRFATDFPDKVQSLGLVASTPKFLAEGDWPGIKPAVLSSFASQLEQDHQGIVDKFMAIQAMGSVTAKQDIKQIKRWVLSKPTPNVETLRSGLDILMQSNLTDEFQNLTVKTHILLGKLDSLVPNRVVPYMRKLNSKVDIRIERKASHAPFISHPDYFIDWLLALIEQD